MSAKSPSGLIRYGFIYCISCAKIGSEVIFLLRNKWFRCVLMTILLASFLIQQPISVHAVTERRLTLNLDYFADPQYTTIKDKKLLRALREIVIVEGDPKNVYIIFPHYQELQAKDEQSTSSEDAKADKAKHFIIFGFQLEKYYYMSINDVVKRKGTFTFTHKQLTEYDSDHYADGIYFPIILAKNKPLNVPLKSGGLMEYKDNTFRDIYNYINGQDGFYPIGYGFNEELNIMYNDSKKSAVPIITPAPRTSPTPVITPKPVPGNLTAPPAKSGDFPYSGSTSIFSNSRGSSAYDSLKPSNQNGNIYTPFSGSTSIFGSSGISNERLNAPEAKKGVDAPYSGNTSLFRNQQDGGEIEAKGGFGTAGDFDLGENGYEREVEGGFATAGDVESATPYSGEKSVFRAQQGGSAQTSKDGNGSSATSPTKPSMAGFLSTFKESLPSAVLLTALGSMLLLWILHAAFTGRS